MKPVIGLGNALVDLLIQMENDDLINELSLPKGGMTLIDENEAHRIAKIIENKNIQKVSGGSAANTIHGLASLGNPCGYIGKINNDELGNFFKDDLNNAGITTNMLKGNASSGRAYTFISPDGERTFATFLGAAVEMSASELNEESFAEYSIFHIEGYLVYNRELIERALILAKKNNMLVSLDMASYNVVEDNLDFLKEVLPKYVDVVFANEEEAKAFTGKEPREAVADFAALCDIAVVKTGKDGSLVQSKGLVSDITIIETIPVDTTGAGDQYAAGFIHGLNQGQAVDKCGKLGSLLAGKVIEQYGARIADKDWQKLVTEAKAIIEG